MATVGNLDARKAPNFLMVQNRKFVKRTLIAMLLLFLPMASPTYDVLELFLVTVAIASNWYKKEALFSKLSYPFLNHINVGSYALYLLLNTTFLLTHYYLKSP